MGEDAKFDMKGGTISNNSASGDGGGVFVWENGTFVKSGSSTIDAINSAMYGKVVYVESSPVKARNSSAGPGVNLDSRISVSAGGWEEESDYPEWFLNQMPYEGFIVGIGVSNSSNESIAITQAQARARVAIAQTLNTNVQAMVIYYYQNRAGYGDSEINLSFFEAISQKVTEQDVSGAVIKSIYIAKRGSNKGTVYCLATLNADDAKKLVADAAIAAGAIAEFNAMNALDRLDEQFAKNEVKPAVLD